MPTERPAFPYDDFRATSADPEHQAALDAFHSEYSSDAPDHERLHEHAEHVRSAPAFVGTFRTLVARSQSTGLFRRTRRHWHLSGAGGAEAPRLKKSKRARCRALGSGEVAEWSNALAWKASRLSKVSGVRISPSPKRVHEDLERSARARPQHRAPVVNLSLEPRAERRALAIVRVDDERRIDEGGAYADILRSWRPAAASSRRRRFLRCSTTLARRWPVRGPRRGLPSYSINRPLRAPP